MKRNLLTYLVVLVAGLMPASATAQLDLGHLLSGGVKAVQAMTITDQQMAQAVHASVVQMDAKNQVAPPDSPYAVRLVRLTSNLREANGLPLNFKVYLTKDVNAFACPDGSVRVFSGLMDIMDDNELLGVIGHEIGHVAKHHSKNAYRNALLTSAARDAIGSAGGIVGALTDSQLGDLGESLLSASYSRKQETEADNYGYDFLKNHGINPLAMAKSFNKLSAVEKQGTANYLTKMFSSHPDTQKRIKNIEKRAKKDGFTYSTMTQTATPSLNSANTSATKSDTVSSPTPASDDNQESQTQKWLKSHGH